MPLHPPPLRRLPLLVLGLAGAAAPAGCASDELTVVVCGNVSVPNEIDAVRIELLDAELTTIRAAVDRLVDDEGRVDALPVRPALEAPTGRGWVRVVGLANQVPVLRFDRQIPDFDDVDAVDAPLVQACLRSFCAEGQTCVAGFCQVAPLGDEPPTCEAVP